MKLTDIVSRVNDKLAGEILTFDALTVFLDETIDDINTELGANFPVFSEFTAANYEQYPDYNFFPDRYIRTAVVIGTAYKFYITDEEGMDTAQKYGWEYQNALFYMLRDYADLVPIEYMDSERGYLTTCPNFLRIPQEVDFRDLL